MDSEKEFSPIPDEPMFERLCIALGKSGMIERYLELAHRYEAPDRADGPGPKMKELVKIIESYGATAKLISKWRLIEFGSEEIHGWRWFGKIVMKRYNAIELQIAGHKIPWVTGSNMNDIWGTTSRLVPGIQPPSGPLPFPVIAYDGDDERLDRMIGDIVEYFNDVKDVIRRDLMDTQIPDRSRKVIGR
jgi:hypothetical protein